MDFTALFKNNTYIGRLPGKTSIFMEEMYASRTALTRILENSREHGSCTIFSDFRRTLLTMKSGAGVSPMGEEIKAEIHSDEVKYLRISFCSAHLHVGIVGNEMAAAGNRL